MRPPARASASRGLAGVRGLAPVCSLSVLGFVLVMTFIALSGCRGNTGAESGTVTFLLDASPTNLDPRIGTDAVSERIDSLLYSGLLNHDEQMRPIPDLALSWQIPDPLTYIFTLRQRVRFHDGRPLTSADVKYTIDSILSGQVKTGKHQAYRWVQSVEALNDATVILGLARAGCFADVELDARRNGDRSARFGGVHCVQQPVGTGPFRLERMTADEEIVLAANPDYFGGRAHVELGPLASCRLHDPRSSCAKAARTSP